MGNFIDNYTESRVREANNMLENFKNNVKYFAIKKSEAFGYRTEIYKVKNISKNYFPWGNGNVVTLVIECIRIEIYEPDMELLDGDRLVLAGESSKFYALMNLIKEPEEIKNSLSSVFGINENE